MSLTSSAEDNAATAEKKTSEMSTAAEIKENKPVSLIYVGPSIPGGVLNRFTVFRGGKPLHLATVFKECPEMERLFVPTADLADVLTKVERTGTPYNAWYSQVLAYIRKGVK